MFKTGSKFLLGLAGFAYVAAIVWAWTTTPHSFGMDSIIGALTFGYKGQVGDHVGYSILMGLAGTSLALGVFLAAISEADAEAVSEVAGLETVPEVVPVTASYWPVVAAFSLGAVVLGLAFGSALFVLGLVGLTICLVEWAAKAWSDRATGDPAVNRDIRDRLMQPFETPIASVLGIAVVVLLVSRILLALPKLGSYLVFGLVPVLILGVGCLIVLRPKLSNNVIAGMLVVGGIALLAGGTAAAIHGERKLHHDKSEKTESGLAPVTYAPSALGGES